MTIIKESTLSKELPLIPTDEIYISEYTGMQSVDLHFHQFIELVFVIEGTCEHYYLGNKTTMVTGDTFIIVPGEEHSYDIHSRTVIINCIFYSEFLKNDWDTLKKMSGIYNFVVLEPLFRFEANNNQILRLNPSELSHVHFLLSLIKKEFDTKSDGYVLAAKSYLLSILMILGRKWEQTYNVQSKSYEKKSELIEKALLYINQNISNHLIVDELASLVYLSPDYFRRIFREVTKMSPVRYINSLRVERAKELLNKTDMTIGEISETVGIGDIQYFSRMFNEIEGISPLKYKKADL
jgi:AraC-like DNA-binding protein